MKLSELINPLLELEKQYGGNIDIDVGMSDCMTELMISKIVSDDGIKIIEPLKIIHCD